MDDLALLRLELETLWITDQRGRLLRAVPDDTRPPPLLVVAACPAGAVWTTSVAVSDAAHGRVDALLTTEPGADELGWAPSCASGLIDAMGQAGDVAVPHGGPSYVVGSPLAPTVDVDLRSEVEIGGVAALDGLIPEADRSLAAPWVVAMVDGRVAAVCETARSTPRSVEAGVWTYEPHRRQGLGAAVTAAWSARVAGRTAFYSTSWDNTASQGVARRLGLRPIGHWWQLSRA